MGLVFASIALILFRYSTDRFISSAGAFSFLYLLFFGFRPLFVLIEEDLTVFEQLFRITISLDQVFDYWAMSALALAAFALGAELARFKFWPTEFAFNDSRSASHPLVPVNFAGFLLACQVGSILAMKFLTGPGAGLAGPLGAYYYDFPVMMQGGHVFSLVAIWERFLAKRDGSSMALFGLSVLLFLGYTIEMRSFSIFRGFWMTGIMIAGIAGLTRLYGKVKYRYLVLPIVILLPIFRVLGEMRYQEEERVRRVISRKAEHLISPESYWTFFDAKGDMNIFDSYVAALESTPEHRPYLLSWLYVGIHFVPRRFWPDKPEAGILVDDSFDNGAPYSPGIVGYFWLDGGTLWMFLSMFSLGMLMTWMDGKVLSLRESYFKYCLYGIVVINAMYLTRFLLFQWAYQIFYMAVPCLILQHIVDRYFGAEQSSLEPQTIDEEP